MRLSDITPKTFACGVGACPKLLKTDDGRAVVIGESVSASELGEHGKRLGKNERAVMIPLELLRSLGERGAL